MPENETLNPDSRSANRWRPLRNRLDQGQLPSDLFPDIEDGLYASLRRVYKQWRDRGVDPAALFNAAVNDHAALHDLVRRSEFDSYVQLLEDVVASEPGSNLEELRRGWLDAVWNQVRDQLQLDRHEASRSASFADPVNQMLDRLHRLLTRNPSRIPSRPHRNKPMDIDNILSRALL